MKKKFKVTKFDNKTISWWNMRRSKIDMDPPYQRRGGLWSDTDKAYLIDSILNEYDVPKLYIADFTWGNSELNVKKLPYAIIDGKQRLEAIFDFYDGKVVLNDDFLYLENPKLKLGGLGYKDLQKNHKEIADEFDNYNLSVMSVLADDEEPINELFVRLNRSKALTGAEVRNAMSGPTPKLIRNLSKHNFFTTNIRFNVKRGQDQNAAAKLLLFEYYNDFRETTKIHLDRFVKFTANEPREKIELSGRHVLDVLVDISNIFLPKDKILISAGIIPVYYWLVKNSKAKNYSLIRKFLMQFEEQRRKNRELVRKNPNSKDINILFVEYDNFNRSTNNQQSHKERYRILKISFDNWLKSGKFITQNTT
jgi:hypothetical protein